MKRLIAVTLSCALIAPGIALSAAQIQPDKTTAAAKPRIEVCFVLDTTGSMSGLIEGAKQKIWSIANEMISAKPTPELRVGLIGYRDRGDEYVTKKVDLTNDIDAIYGHLQSFRANGGGDTPESVNEALDQAVREMSWSSDRKVLKIIFLVGDAPPHMDYANGPKYPEICQAAAKKDLIINTVQCGSIAETAPVWKEIARLSEGSYAPIAQSGNMAVITTPMDEELAALNRKLGKTLVAYGAEPARRALSAKQMASENAPASLAADRLYFNFKNGVAVQGEGELLDALNSGKLKIDSLKKDQLPAELQKLDEPELKAEVEKRQQERTALQTQIQKLSQQREEYLATERKRVAAEGKGDAFDDTVAQTIRSQAARKNIQYQK